MELRTILIYERKLVKIILRSNYYHLCYIIKVNEFDTLIIDEKTSLKTSLPISIANNYIDSIIPIIKCPFSNEINEQLLDLKEQLIIALTPKKGDLK